MLRWGTAEGCTAEAVAEAGGGDPAGRGCRAGEGSEQKHSITNPPGAALPTRQRGQVFGYGVAAMLSHSLKQ